MSSSAKPSLNLLRRPQPATNGYLRTWTYTAGRGTRGFRIELDATEDCAALIEIELMLVHRFLETPNTVAAQIPKGPALGVLAWRAVHQYRFGVIEVSGDIASVESTVEQVARHHNLTLDASLRLIAAFDAYRQSAIEGPRDPAAVSVLKVRKEYKLKPAPPAHGLASHLLPE